MTNSATNYKISMPNRVDSLTGLRIFAALSIVLHHLQGVLWIPDLTFQGIYLLQHGVSFFYVLSGFILQHSYRDRLTSISWGQFFTLRFLRIWPCHIAVLCLLPFFWSPEEFNWYRQHVTTGLFFIHIFLLQSWSLNISNVFMLNAPAWSISVELFFYSLFLALSWQSLKGAFRPLIFTSMLTGAWLITVIFLMPDGDLTALTGTFPLARLIEFGLGITVYELSHRHLTNLKIGIFKEIFLLCIVGFIAFLSLRLSYLISSQAVMPPLARWSREICSMLAFSILIVVFFKSSGLLSRVLSSRAVVFLGEISFALYLVHQPLINYFKTSSSIGELFVTLQVMLFILAVLVLSSILHFVVERPFMALAKRLVLTHRKSKIPTVNLHREEL